MPTLNTSTSVVDFIKSTGGDSSFDTRAQLAVDQGIVSETSQYSGSSSQNESLLSKLSSSGTTSTASQSGIVTSDSAFNTVNTARDTLNDIGSNTGSTTDVTSTGRNNGVQNRLAQLFKQLSRTRSLLAESKEKERIAKENLTDTELQAGLDKLDSSEEAGKGADDLSGGINAINKTGAGEETDTGIIDDPVLRGITDSTINTITSIQAQVTRLDAFRKTMSDFSQAEVNDISATALRSVERQITENDRVRRSLEFAGIIGGRAQFAPTVEGTLIHEIIQDGLDKIDVIEDKKNTAIRQARQAEVEFDYALFTDSVNLAKEFHKEIEDGITKLKVEVRQAEKDEQDKITFNQQQQDRNAIILAPEIFEETKDMTSEEQQDFISKVSVANNIPLGSLLREVRDYTPEPEKVEAVKSGSGALIGDFSQSDSDKLRSAGLEEATIEDKRQYLFGNSEARQMILDKYSVVAEPATMDDVITEIKEKMDLFGTFGKSDNNLDTRLHTQARNFGVAKKIRGAEGDVKALLKHPAVEPAVEAELAAGTSVEDILEMLANDALMSRLLAEHKAK